MGWMRIHQKENPTLGIVNSIPHAMEGYPDEKFRHRKNQHLFF
jgi:hypothetical protein